MAGVLTIGNSSGTAITETSVSATPTATWTAWVDDWDAWHGGTASASTTGWDNWIKCRGHSYATNNTSTIVWNNWNRYDQIRLLMAQQAEAAYKRPREAPAIVSEETRRALRLQQEEYEKKLAIERELRRAAEEKAEILLRSVLSPEQKEDLSKRNCFYLYSKGKKYRIDRGQHGNVKLVNEKNEVIESYCIQPRGGLPDADAMAAQKLLLETSPETFRQIANVSDRRGYLIQRGIDMPAMAVG